MNEVDIAAIDGALHGAFVVAIAWLVIELRRLRSSVVELMATIESHDAACPGQKLIARFNKLRCCTAEDFRDD